MEKIKRIITNSIESDRGKDILIIIIVILVGLASFELGRLSKNSSEDLKIEYPDNISDQSGNVISALKSNSNILQNDKMNQKIQNSVGKSFFASNRGKKYYSLGCSAGKTIKQENRVYFNTGEEAERAGYTLSNSCS